MSLKKGKPLTRTEIPTEIVIEMSRYTLLTILVLNVGIAIADEWGYSGEEGPDHWPDLEGSFCGGSSQSPINIVTVDTMWKDLGDLDLDGYSLDDDDAGVPTMIENNGHSLTVYLDDNYVLSGSGLAGDYKAVQFHFHWGREAGRGSEHTLEGMEYDAEMHIVHYNSDDYDSFEDAAGADDSKSLAVLGVFLQIGENDNEAFNKVFELAQMVEYKGDTRNLNENDTFSVADLLPDDISTYYRYSGSLTTPKCNEIVIWTVFREVVTISEAQINVLRGLHEGTEESKTIGDNYRPVQPLNDRVVYYNGGPGALTPAVTLILVMVVNTIHHISY